MNEIRSKVGLMLIAVLCIVCLCCVGCGNSGKTGPEVLLPTEETTENTVPPFIDDTGDYLGADKFSFSGGTGKVGISCDSITFNGQDYNAMIVLDSDAYTYVRVGETKYDCEQINGQSWAAIPVTVNENNTIYAETTKMSQPHEIEYQIFIYLDNAKSGEDPYALLKTNALDEEAPFVPGLTATQKEPSEEGDAYKVFSYDNGVRVLEVKMKDAGDATLDAFDYAAYTTKAQTKEDAQAALYTKNVVKYILAPEGTVLPAGIEKEAIVVTTPAENVYRGDMSISPKDLVANHYDLVLLNADVLSDGGEAFENFAADAASLGIPVMIDHGIE